MLRTMNSERARCAHAGVHWGESGSGTAIGVAILFPILMLVIVALAALTRSSRTEQVLQAAADRAALTASICCLYADGPRGAVPTVEANLVAARIGWRQSQVSCSNDVVADSEIAFLDVAGDEVLIDPGSANGGWSDPGDLYMKDPEANIVTRDADGDPNAFDPDYAVFQPDGTALTVYVTPNIPPELYYLVPDTSSFFGVRRVVLDPVDYPGVGQRAAVPPGGMAQVLVECRVPPEVLGSVGLPGIDITHRAVGQATVDPYRHRFDLIRSP